jgi:hypothetical protein
VSVTIVPVLTLRLYQLVCSTTTKPGAVVPTETDVWFPVSETVTTLPNKPEYDTEQELIPANSALVDDCFDPDNVDTQQLFNNFIPQGDTEPVYDVSANISNLIPAKNQLVPIRYRLRSVLVVLKADSSLKAKTTDVFFGLKLPVEFEAPQFKITASTGQFTYQALAPSALLQILVSSAATAYTLRGINLITVGGFGTVQVGVVPIDFGVFVGGLPKTIDVPLTEIGVVALQAGIKADTKFEVPAVNVRVEVFAPTIEIDDSVYFFDQFEFTNGTQTGRLGPSYANLTAAYDTNQYEWLLDTSFYDAQNGIQTWTVPQSSTYRITAFGASGGGTENRGGRGAIIEGEFDLTVGTKIDILVGQEGPLTNGLRSGGGGGSFVVEKLTGDVLIVAGGGAGSSDLPNTPFAGMHASLTTSGKNATNVGGSGGANGSGGGGSGEGAGGGGMFGDGGSGGAARLGGSAYVLGGNGGLSPEYGEGGFGGGGAGWESTGGGGGYSGGGGGDFAPGGPLVEDDFFNFGGGGGSFNSGANTSSAVRSDAGHGKVIIVRL